MNLKNTVRTIFTLCAALLLVGCNGDTDALRNSSTDLAIVLVLLVATVVMFALNRPRMDATALIMMTVLPLTGIITINESIAGLSDPTIVLIATLFVLGEGLVRTGVAQRLGDLVIRYAGHNEARLIAVLMVAVASIGSVMSSTGVVAIFIPIVLRIAHGSGIAPGRLMMPLSVGALISGMMTLVATPPNLVVHGELVRHGYEGFSFFAFAPFGIPILVLAVGYMLFARRWLAATTGTSKPARRRPRLREWIDQYQLADRVYRVRVTSHSALVGKRLEELSLRSAGVNLLAIERSRRFATDLIRPMAQTRLQVDDILVVDVLAPDVEIEALRREFALEGKPLAVGGRYFTDRSQEIGMVEVIIPAESELVGQTVLQAEVRSEYGLTVIGLRRGQAVATERADAEAGSTLSEAERARIASAFDEWRDEGEVEP